MQNRGAFSLKDSKSKHINDTKESYIDHSKSISSSKISKSNESQRNGLYIKPKGNSQEYQDQ